MYCLLVHILFTLCFKTRGFSSVHLLGYKIKRISKKPNCNRTSQKCFCRMWPLTNIVSICSVNLEKTTSLSCSCNGIQETKGQPHKSQVSDMFLLIFFNEHQYTMCVIIFQLRTGRVVAELNQDRGTKEKACPLCIFSYARSLVNL